MAGAPNFSRRPWPRSLCTRSIHQFVRPSGKEPSVLFVETRFFFFFAVVFGVAWALRSNTARKAFLLACGYIFYACFFVGDPIAFLSHLMARQWTALPPGWWFPFVLLGSTCVDYFVGSD